jgi:PPP family 3-phenylpropionic acid transporter
MDKTTATQAEPQPENPDPRQPRRLWVPWMLFFFQYTAIGAYFVYLNVYLRQAGLSGTQLGVLNMSSSIIGVVSALFWGYISDRTGKPRFLIAFGAFGSLIVVQFIPLVHSFWAFFAIACLGAVLSSSLTTLVDGVTLAMLGSNSENYGRFRLGGSIGYILASSTSGFVYDRTGLGLIFPVYGVLMGCFALIALLLPNIPVKVERRASTQIGAMIRQPAWVIFALCVFLVWIANYSSIMYLGVTLLSMGASQSLIGLASTSAALIEIPFMAFSGWLIRKMGLRRLILVAIVLMVMRYLLLAWMPTPNLAFYINILNGPAYGLFATCIVAYAKSLAPPSLNVTSQGLLNSTINLAGVVSALMTGVLFDQIGPQKIFLVMAACCLAGLALFGLGALQKKPKLAEEPLS